MTKAQGIGTLAAIGCLTAVIALQSGLPVAKADEMADLRANQQLLQQRIDQLAQAQAQALPQTKAYPGTAGPMGTKAIPGQPLAGGSFPRSFLIPGTDTSIRVGGFVDFTALEFLQGGGNVNGSNYGSNAGQNGNVISLPVAGRAVPGPVEHLRAGLGQLCAVAQQRYPRIQPAAIAPQCRNPHPDQLGRSADLLRIRLGRHATISAARPWRQGGGNSLLPAVPFRVWHLGRVPRRPGDLELLRRRCRHRINGIRRHPGLDRRPAHPAGALHDPRPLWQRFLGISGKPVHDGDHAGRGSVERLQPIGYRDFDKSGSGDDPDDLQRRRLHRDQFDWSRWDIGVTHDPRRTRQWRKRPT